MRLTLVAALALAPITISIVAVPAIAQTRDAADVALKQLFADSDEALLRRNPLEALFPR